MKTLRTLATLIVSMIALTSCAQKITFPSLEGQSDVTKIYVGKAMLKMAGGDISGADIPKDIAKKMDSIEVITSEKSSGAQKIQSAFNAYVTENPNMEVLVQVDDNKSKVNIFAVPDKTPDTYSKIIIYVIDGEDNETVLVVMNGKITADDLTEFAKITEK